MRKGKIGMRLFRKFWIVLIFVLVVLPKQGISEEKNEKSVFDEKSVNLKIKIDKDKVEYQIFAYIEPGTPMTWCGDDTLVIGDSAEPLQKKLRIISLKDVDLFQYKTQKKVKVKEINLHTEDIYDIVGCVAETDTVYLKTFDNNHIYALNLRTDEIKKILTNIKFKAFDVLNNILVVTINNKSYIDNQFLRNDGIKLIKIPNSFDVNWEVLYILPNNKLLMYETGKFYIYDYQLNKLTELGKAALRLPNIDHQILCDYDYKNNKFFILCWDINSILKSEKGKTIKPNYTIEVPSLSDFKVISSQVLIYAENKKDYDYLCYYFFQNKKKELIVKYHNRITNANPFLSEKPCSYCFTQSSVTGNSLAYLLKDRIVIITYR
jgi:hypothetical protein